WRQITNDQVGTGQPNVNGTKLGLLKIVIPPLQTQQAIVSKIEELFSELDKGIEDLKTAQQQLKTYRQSVLKWAFEGKLTNENVKDGELPKGWKIVDLKEVCEIKRGKSKHRPRNAPELYGGNYPFIQTGDIRNANGGYIKKYSQTYSEMGLAQSKLWPKGTLCITIAANIGETAILDFDACFPDSVVGLLSKKDVLLNKYLNYFFISFKQKLEELAPATAQKNINVDILEKVKIPIAPYEEQHHIVQEIESRLSVADKMEESTAQSLQQAEALRQSILKKAFNGELV
ncbi:MAG: restriction endonuclease subunit S, partial [Flavobacterium sp.]|nr:restriction endonuclease subunit S [Flavobacterium sp.]